MSDDLRATADQTVRWLRALAEKGGKGVVDNIDARCLGRVADRLEREQRARKAWEAESLEQDEKIRAAVEAERAKCSQAYALAIGNELLNRMAAAEIEDRVRAAVEAERAENERLKQALREYAYTGSDTPCGCYNEFLRDKEAVRAAVEAERAPLVEALEQVRARARATTNVSLEECRRQLSLIDRIADEAIRSNKPERSSTPTARSEPTW